MRYIVATRKGPPLPHMGLRSYVVVTEHAMIRYGTAKEFAHSWAMRHACSHPLILLTTEEHLVGVINAVEFTAEMELSQGRVGYV
jgi:hypothetical protein